MHLLKREDECQLYLSKTSAHKMKWGMAMFEPIKPDQKLNCLGLYCSEPVFRTRIEIDRLAVGQVLEVLTCSQGLSITGL